MTHTSAQSMSSAKSANAISGSIIQNSAKWREVLLFSALNVGPANKNTAELCVSRLFSDHAAAGAIARCVVETHSLDRRQMLQQQQQQQQEQQCEHMCTISTAACVVFGLLNEWHGCSACHKNVNIAEQ